MPETSALWFRENTSPEQPPILGAQGVPSLGAECVPRLTAINNSRRLENTPPQKGGGLHHHPFRMLRSTFCLLVLSQMNR